MCRPRTIIACVALMIACAGCRVPDPPVLKDSPPQVLYDTSYERDDEGGIRPAVATGVWDEYHETLAEPVAVTHWGDTSASWEVYFATNRGIVTEGAGTEREQFGNFVLERPVYGRAVVVLPKHKRGQNILLTEQMEKRSKLLGRWSSTLPVASGPPAEFESIQSCSPQKFASGITRQVSASRQRDVLVFVHGFNVSLDAALVRAAQLGWDLPFNGALIAYGWPTQGGVQNYVLDEPINSASVAPFLEFLETLDRALPRETRVHIVVHSMGNRIVMQALGKLPPRADGAPRFANVCLCAPDVGEEDFARWIPGVVAQCERVTLYCNASDSALILSEGLHSERRAGDAERPLRSEGVDTIDCTRVDLSLSGHSYFSANVDVLTDLFAVLKENKPPEQRHYLERIDDSDGLHHWQFNARPGEILWTWNFDSASPDSATPPQFAADFPPEPSL